jgi:protein-disulfide isomerase
MRTSLLALPFLFACDQDNSNAHSTASAAATSPSATDSGEIMATWEGGSFTRGQLQKEIGTKLTQLEAEYLTNRYQTEIGALEQLATIEMIEAEAKAKGHADAQSLLKAEIDNTVTPPTEAEIQEAYAVLKRRLGNKSLDEVRDSVAMQALRQKQGVAYQAWIEELKTRKGLKLNIAYPNLPRIAVSSDDDPFIGAEDAPITIVQFAEYQCPYCSKSNETVEQVMEAYPGKIKMVYRDFPLSFHDRAVPAAVAANCAGQQGKYWEMHKVLMANQRRLQADQLTAYGEGLGLDMAAFAACQVDPAQTDEVNKDLEDGMAVGVSGTPAFFINGIMLSGAQGFEAFQTIIDRELAG